jgi:CRISPR/Cas system CMR subunit Cmr6 (Cas7 group RAMP superfamily)
VRNNAVICQLQSIFLKGLVGESPAYIFLFIIKKGIAMCTSCAYKELAKLKEKSKETLRDILQPLF